MSETPSLDPEGIKPPRVVPNEIRFDESRRAIQAASEEAQAKEGGNPQKIEELKENLENLDIKRATSFEQLFQILEERKKEGKAVISRNGEVFDAELTRGKVDAILKQLGFVPTEQIPLLELKTITSSEGLRDKVRELIIEFHSSNLKPLQENPVKNMGSRKSWWRRLFGGKE